MTGILNAGLVSPGFFRNDSFPLGFSPAGIFPARYFPAGFFPARPFPVLFLPRPFFPPPLLPHFWETLFKYQVFTYVPILGGFIDEVFFISY